MKLYECDLDPITNSRIKIKLFREVDNVPELRKKIVAGELKCCIINPKLIVDPFQVIVAANKALVAAKHEKLVTRTIYSEILFNLSPSKNMRNSLLQFGIDDKNTDLLVAILDELGTTSDEIFKSIEGNEYNIEELKNITDLKAVKKAYNISSDEDKSSDLLNVIVNKIVIKDVL